MGSALTPSGDLPFSTGELSGFDIYSKSPRKGLYQASPQGI
jgi:hypothetical protein